MSKLETFLKGNRIRPAHIARDSGVSLRYILNLRLGRAEPTRRIMVALATSARRILRRPVDPAEMFDLAPPLFLVDAVTPEQGETFAREWIESSLSIADVYDAFVDAGVLEWPGDDNEAMRDRYDALEAEIIRRTFDAVRAAIAEAFVRVANEVIRRER
jgi:transcriptional regulator with XRE-family HTH domain